MALSQTLALERHTFIGLRRCRGNMFEALEGMLEKSKLPLDPAWPILMHSISALFGLFYVIEGCEGMPRLGFSSEPSCSCCL